MMVVAVLMTSCQVSRFPNAKYDGAQTTTSKTQNAKNGARLAVCAACAAKRSKNPTSVDTSLGKICGCLECAVVTPVHYPKIELIKLRVSGLKRGTDGYVDHGVAPSFCRSRAIPKTVLMKEHTMTQHDTGPEAGLKGAVEGVKGKIKEVVGSVTGNSDVRREGEAQQEKAAAQRDVAAKEADAEKARAEAAVHEAEQRSFQK